LLQKKHIFISKKKCGRPSVFYVWPEIKAMAGSSLCEVAESIRCLSLSLSDSLSLFFISLSMGQCGMLDFIKFKIIR
jgi:hypothetical protein